MNFQISPEDEQLRQRSRRLAQGFAARAAEHDRAASHPLENYAALRQEGFYGLNIPQDMGGEGVGLLGYSLAAEQLAQGCPSTALSFNMHVSIVGPLFESPDVSPGTKAYLADLVVKQRKLIAGNFSEPSNSGLLATYKPATLAKRVAGGYRLTGRKAFASMLEAADFCAVLAHPAEAASSAAAILVLVPREVEGRRVEQVWDTLGMRATRSDSLILEDCFVPEQAGLYQVDDVLPFIRNAANWLWASYTAVYLGVAAAAYDALREMVRQRVPKGYSQPLAYHPDVRRRVAEMSVDLEAARLMTYHSAWLSDSQGPTQQTLAALFRAKYLVGEAVARITRTALTVGGAHALFKTTPIERLFRDGAVGAIQFPPSDFCLSSVGSLELGLDPREVVPSLK